MLDRYPGGKEALLDEVRAGRTSPEIEACVMAGQKVYGAPSPPPLTLSLTLTLTQALTLTPTLALTLGLTLT